MNGTNNIMFEIRAELEAMPPRGRREVLHLLRFIAWRQGQKLPVSPFVKNRVIMAWSVARGWIYYVRHQYRIG